MGRSLFGDIANVVGDAAVPGVPVEYLIFRDFSQVRPLETAAATTEIRVDCVITECIHDFALISSNTQHCNLPRK